MRRQGWAFCLGMFVSGSAWAQPPASDERFPPAPSLPNGVVVSKPSTPEKNKEVTVTPFAVQRASLQVTEAPLPPLPSPTTPVTTTMVPYTNTVTAISTPLATANCGPTCATPTCTTPNYAPHSSVGHMTHLPDWLKFRSQAKQSGHVPSSYTPPLYAWFPPGCVTNKPSAQAGSHCATGHCGSTMIPQGTIAMPHSTPITVPGLPTPLPHATSVVPTPNQAMIPYTPAPSNTAPESDHLAGFRKVNDGLLFTPGGSPMAAPVKPVSRPK